MTRKQIELWLFPPITETEPQEVELISNKRFIIMVALGIIVPIICKVINQ